MCVRGCNLLVSMFSSTRICNYIILKTNLSFSLTWFLMLTGPSIVVVSENNKSLLIKPIF